MRRYLAAPLLAVLLGGCQSAFEEAVEAHGEQTRAIAATLDELYQSFCFDAGGEADWDRMRKLFAEGAVFYAPIVPGTSPRGVGADEFVNDFRSWILESEVGRTGLYERVIDVRFEMHGSVAHAWVMFEGYVPPRGDTITWGIDTIQLVLDGERWLVASFATHYFRQ